MFALQTEMCMAGFTLWHFWKGPGSPCFVSLWGPTLQDTLFLETWFLPRKFLFFAMN